MSDMSGLNILSVTTRISLACSRAETLLLKAISINLLSLDLRRSLASAAEFSSLGMILCNARIRAALDGHPTSQSTQGKRFLALMSKSLSSLLDAKLSLEHDCSDFDRIVWLIKSESLMDDVENQLKELIDSNSVKENDFARSRF